MIEHILTSSLTLPIHQSAKAKDIEYKESDDNAQVSPSVCSAPAKCSRVEFLATVEGAVTTQFRLNCVWIVNVTRSSV